MTFFWYWPEALAWICGSRLPGIVSAQSNTSALPFSTDSAFASTFEEIFTFTSTWPAGMPGMFIFDQSGFRTSSNDWFGTMFVILYGPTPGGGLFGMFFIGVPFGTSPRDGNASTLPNAPYGEVRLIVIFPVASSVLMPEIVFALPAAYAFAPTIVPAMNWPE